MKKESPDEKAVFKPEYTTMDILKRLEEAGSLEEFDNSFADDNMTGASALLRNYLQSLLNKYDRSDEEVSIEAGYTHEYLYKVLRGLRNPGRDFLLAVCAVIGTTLDEVQTLLKYAQLQPLYPRRKRDAIIWYGFANGQSLYILDKNLKARGHAPLYKD